MFGLLYPAWAAFPVGGVLEGAVFLVGTVVLLCVGVARRAREQRTPRTREPEWTQYRE